MLTIITCHVGSTADVRKPLILMVSFRKHISSEVDCSYDERRTLFDNYHQWKWWAILNDRNVTWHDLRCLRRANCQINLPSKSRGYHGRSCLYPEIDQTGAGVKPTHKYSNLRNCPSQNKASLQVMLRNFSTPGWWTVHSFLYIIRSLKTRSGSWKLIQTMTIGRMIVLMLTFPHSFIHQTF